LKHKQVNIIREVFWLNQEVILPLKPGMTVFLESQLLRRMETGGLQVES
jgi:hypothetical protein